MKAKQKAGQDLAHIHIKLPVSEKVEFADFADQEGETITFTLRRAMKYYRSYKIRKNQREAQEQREQA